jgi:hypothetical protein
VLSEHAWLRFEFDVAVTVTVSTTVMVTVELDAPAGFWFDGEANRTQVSRARAVEPGMEAPFRFWLTLGTTQEQGHVVCTLNVSATSPTETAVDDAMLELDCG